jgi:UDP-glucuronate 4-epimerase
MKIPVTGEAGLISSNLMEQLVADDYKVIVYDNFNTNYSPTHKLCNIFFARQSPNYRLVVGDIRDEKELNAVFAKELIDVVISWQPNHAYFRHFSH